MAMIPPELRGLGRGILGLKNWNEPRKPGPSASPAVRRSPPKQEREVAKPEARPAEQKAPQENQSNKPRRGNKLIAKHNFKANPDSPLEKGELNLKQGQVVTFVQPHPENEHWWEAQNEEGQRGCVPASYMKILESQQMLPWLQNKMEPEVETEEAVFKPYKSAYSKTAAEKDENQYHCSICEKTLNGPKPYAAHMASRAHREEVEAQME